METVFALETVDFEHVAYTLFEDEEEAKSLAKVLNKLKEKRDRWADDLDGSPKPQTEIMYAGQKLRVGRACVRTMTIINK